MLNTSFINNSIVYMSGTSMSTPHIPGAISLQQEFRYKNQMK
ncbi:S8 family serine peptidase [Peribacillus sp. TH27]